MRRTVKTLLSLAAVTACLYGCPDTRVPQTPPNIPQPKAMAATALPAGTLPA